MNVPGFIDLQVNGYLGVDFSDRTLTEDEFVRVSGELLNKTVCAGFLVTVITSSEEIYQRNLPIIARAMKRPEFAGRILGIHAEGPFLSDKPGAVGAHNPAWVRKPSVEFFKKMQTWAEGNIRVITIAAENEGADELTRYCCAHGVAVSLGHQLAQPEDLARCAKAGATLLTHLGNGIPNSIDRHRNPIWAGLANDHLTAMIIADGHHLPADVVKVMVRAKGFGKILVVSDASPIAGMPPGVYNTLGNVAVLEENGLLHNPEKKCLVGSSATIEGCVKFLMSLDVFSTEEIVELAWEKPLKAIGMTRADIKVPDDFCEFDAAAKVLRRLK